MRILFTGISGFTGSILARTLQEFDSGIELWGIDNFVRTGSEQIARHLGQRESIFFMAACAVGVISMSYRMFNG